MNKENKPKVVLSDGNAFAIIGEMKSAAKKANWSREKILEMSSEAMSGDYDNVLRTAGKYFDVHLLQEQRFSFDEDDEDEDDIFDDEDDFE